MEKTLTRLKSNLKSRRKLSLPMLAGAFPWQQQQAANEAQIDEASPRAESAEILTESDASPSNENAEQEDCEVNSSASRQKTWLSFGKSRHAKQRNKPRRWPSTPAILPTTRPTLNPTQQVASQSSGRQQHHASAGSLASATVRPQPFIQGYHLTLPSFLCQRAHHHSPTTKVDALIAISFSSL